MNKRMGRPKIGTRNAKGEVFAARFTPPEAKHLQAAISKSRSSKSEWIRTALLTVAKSEKSVS